MPLVREEHAVTSVGRGGGFLGRRAPGAAARAVTRLAYCLLVALLLVACGGSGQYVWIRDLPPPSAAEAAKLRVGDKVQLAVLGHDTLGGEFEIRPTGDVVLPQMGLFVARGFTVEQLRTNVTARLNGILQNPQVTVVLVSRRLPNVSVIGEVSNPGRYQLGEREGVLDALARAGGFTPFADEDAIFIISRTRGGPRIRFRYDDLTRGDPASVGYELSDGDVVVVE